MSPQDVMTRRPIPRHGSHGIMILRDWRESITYKVSHLLRLWVLESSNVVTLTLGDYDQGRHLATRSIRLRP